MSVPELEIDLPEASEVRDRFSRRVAIMMVAATFLGAIVALFQASAGRRSDEAALEARSQASQSMAALVAGQQRAVTGLESFVRAEERAFRASSAKQAFIFLSGGFEETALLAQKRWERLAEVGRVPEDLRPGSDYGPVLDPLFPNRYLISGTHEAVLHRALQDGANEESNAWSAKVSAYTAILTVVAVAVYLLGLSLSVKLEIRRMFARLGLGLVLLAMGATALVRAGTPPTLPQEAADAFSDGYLQLQTANWPGDYEEAIRSFDRAIELRPGFAQAYEHRAEARFAAGSPSLAPSISSRAAVAASTADLRRAVEIGVESSTALANLGLHEFLLGVYTKSEELLQSALEHTRRAAELDPTSLVLSFNEAVTLLSLDRAEEARETYERAIRSVIFSDPASETRRHDPATEEFYVAGALTDLETLARARPELAEEVRQLKELLVGSASRGRVGVGETAMALPEGTIDVEVFAGEVQWTAFLPGYNADTDIVSQQWYREGPEKLGWAALPSVSGVHAPRLETDEGYFQLNSYLASTFPPSCLAAGTYRVELYANGRLVGSGEAQINLPELVGYVNRDLNFAVCRPREWRRSESSIPGWLEGFIGPDGDQGVYFVHWYPPKEATLDLLDATIDIFNNVFPDKPLLDELEGTDTDFFLGLENPRKRWYNYEGGYVRAGAGRTGSGSVLVAFVFGPTDLFDEAGDLGLRLVDSMIEIEPVT